MSIIKTDRYEWVHGDCIEEVAKLGDESIHYWIFSPPFASLYTYSDSPRDMGNCSTDEQFYTHFKFLAKELYRSLKPGRCLSFHCMNLPFSKERDGFIGIKDFRGNMIRLLCGGEAAELHIAISHLERRLLDAVGDYDRQAGLASAINAIHADMRRCPASDVGFIFHSEVCVWKDPVTAMQRTKALGLLHKQIKKDSCMSRQGIPDYLVTMRKPGVNAEPVTHTNESFPVSLWQEYASPVWMDIKQSRTLQKGAAREHDDERHICPLQLDVIERGILLWTNPGDLVASPFGGISSEPFKAVELGRRGWACELKESYWKQGAKNLATLDTGQVVFDWGSDDLIEEPSE